MIKLLNNLLKLLLNQRPSVVNNEFLQIILNRKSCRNFSDKPVTQDLISKVLLAGASSPSTVNLQTWSFFPFQYEEWKEKFGAPIPFGGRAAIIVAADLKRLEIIDNTYKKYPLFFYTLAVMNASLAAMSMALAVEALGMKSIMLSQTGKTGLMDIKYLKEKLLLPDCVFPLTTLVFGYSKSDILFSPPKLSKDVTIHNKSYKIKEGEVKEWLSLMNTACLLAEKEKITEKFDKYVKLLPKAEEELNNAFSKIKD